jgi:hypothetical protein
MNCKKSDQTAIDLSIRSLKDIPNGPKCDQKEPSPVIHILIGGLIGWGIDLLTNRVANPSEDTYYLQYRKKQSEKPQTEQTK